MLAGAPNTGKSALIQALTGVGTVVADYPFSTVHPVPDMLGGDGGALQLIDTPPVVPGLADGEGPGRPLLHLMSLADVLAVVVIVPHPTSSHRSLAGCRVPGTADHVLACRRSLEAMFDIEIEFTFVLGVPRARARDRHDVVIDDVDDDEQGTFVLVPSDPQTRRQIRRVPHRCAILRVLNRLQRDGRGPVRQIAISDDVPGVQRRNYGAVFGP